MPLAKATLINTSTGAPIRVMFNPEEYTLTRQATWADARVPGLESPLVQFINGGIDTLSMNLFFDTTEDNRDVRLHIDLLTKLLELDPKNDAPPVILFVWGSLTFPCVIEALSRNFTMFDSKGIPLRATVTVTFRGSNPLELLIAKNPFRSLDHERKHIVKAGETLSQIAWQEYQDASLWRLIAQENKIDNPRKLQAGQVLLVPPLK
jgi:hypothetical protein